MIPKTHMDKQRFAILYRAISTSLIVMPIQRKFLLGRLATIKDSESDELERLLARADDIDWKKELPAYELATQKAIQLYDQTTEKLRDLSPTS